MFNEIPPGPVPLAVLDATLGDDVVLVVEVAHGQGAGGHEGDSPKHHFRRHLADEGEEVLLGRWLSLAVKQDLERSGLWKDYVDDDDVKCLLFACHLTKETLVI